MAIRRDPSATGLIVRGFSREIRSRFVLLSDEIKKKLVVEDSLGLEPVHVMVNAERRAWEFRTDQQKIESFTKWLQDQIDQKILHSGPLGRSWAAKYTDAAYAKGIRRAYTDVNRGQLPKSPDFLLGATEQYVKSLLQRPASLAQANLLASRAFTDLQGISAEAATKLNRILADGLLKGTSARDIAREMTKQIKGMTSKRALTIARTEIIHAHAEGQLDSFEELGIDKVGLYAEWSTAKDEKVCKMCEPLEGVLFTIEEARGLIPRHPNCRCAWVPGGMRAGKNRPRTQGRRIRDSILAEKPGLAKRGREGQRLSKTEMLRRIKKSSTWYGKKK